MITGTIFWLSKS